MRVFPLEMLETVDMRFKADENWKRRRMVICVRWDAELVEEMTSPDIHCFSSGKGGRCDGWRYLARVANPEPQASFSPSDHQQ
jgi:hypothetical protein